MEKPRGKCDHVLFMSVITFNQLPPDLFCGEQLALVFMRLHRHSSIKLTQEETHILSWCTIHIAVGTNYYTSVPLTVIYCRELLSFVWFYNSDSEEKIFKNVVYCCHFCWQTKPTYQSCLSSSQMATSGLSKLSRMDFYLGFVKVLQYIIHCSQTVQKNRTSCNCIMAGSWPSIHCQVSCIFPKGQCVHTLQSSRFLIMKSM